MANSGSTAVESPLPPQTVESLPEVLDQGINSSKPTSTAIDGFQDALKSLRSRDEEQKKSFPENLPGGVLLDQYYGISPKDLNRLVFAPDSKLMLDFLGLQKASRVVEGEWELGDDELKRVLTFTKPGTFFSSMKVVEEHVYLKADEQAYAVLEIISTPEVPFGSSFRIEVLFRITSGPKSPPPSSSSGEETSHLVISWRVNFVEATIISSMIEGGAKQGLKEQYDMFAKLLAETVKPLESEQNGVLGETLHQKI